MDCKVYTQELICLLCYRAIYNSIACVFVVFILGGPKLRGFLLNDDDTWGVNVGDVCLQNCSPQQLTNSNQNLFNTNQNTKSRRLIPKSRVPPILYAASISQNLISPIKLYPPEMRGRIILMYEISHGFWFSITHYFPSERL